MSHYIYEVLRDLLTLQNPWKSAVIAVAAGFILKKLELTLEIRLLLRKVAIKVSGSDEDEKIECREDVVYLYMFPTSYTKQVPNLSPFAIKVETWLKLKNIEYEVVETRTFSKTTKQLPYIVLNGEEVPDSNLIIEYLTTYFKLDPTDGLSDEQLGISRAIQRMVDEATCWTYFLDRYSLRPHVFARVFRPFGNSFLRKKILAGLANQFAIKAHNQGTGRHPPRTVAKIGCNDIRAISMYLQNKEFLMGDEPTTVDCAVFGHLSQIMFVDFPYAHKDMFDEECINLRHYLYRIRDRLWPDWFGRAAPGEFDED